MRADELVNDSVCPHSLPFEGMAHDRIEIVIPRLPRQGRTNPRRIRDQFARIARATGFGPPRDLGTRHALDRSALLDLFMWSEQEFMARTEGSPIRRIGYECWLRNLAVGLGNAESSPQVLAALRTRRESASAMVKEHIDWALAQHEGAAP